MGILKVILILLLSLLALLLLILALNVRLSVLLGDSTTWRITLGGIPIDPHWFSGKKNKHPKREKKKKGNERGKADTAPAGDKTPQPERTKKKSTETLTPLNLSDRMGEKP